eukprot:TRINITY_DN16598_c0_g1_i1.p1 TRINITY_DN16598_c0_g1~~TRINITY_DN16598_c0_g1_i1.p1  ORF type:complete len:231 (+),score=27.29 TRINITY_DN16598_c0_g1_i1:134-826(+)
MHAWVKRWDEVEQRPPQGNNANRPSNHFGSASSSTGPARGSGKGRRASNPSKRFRGSPQTRLQAVERLSRSTAHLAQQTARTVASLLSYAMITILCPELEALRIASVVRVEDPTDPLEVQYQRWGCLTQGLASDPKTSSTNADVLRAHVTAVSKSDQLVGKLLACRCKPTFRDSNLYLIQFKVSDELQPAARAIIETLVKAGGTVSYLPGSRSPAKRQVQFDLDALDQVQ